MLFTPGEISRIMLCLGYPPGQNYRADVVNTLNFISDQLYHDRAIALLDRLTELDGKISSSLESLNLKKVDSIEFFGGASFKGYFKEANRKIQELANLLSLRIMFNKYAISGKLYGTYYS